MVINETDSGFREGLRVKSLYSVRRRGRRSTVFPEAAR